jgi:hypothetical protein
MPQSVRGLDLFARMDTSGKDSLIREVLSLILGE